MPLSLSPAYYPQIQQIKIMTVIYLISGSLLWLISVFSKLEYKNTDYIYKHTNKCLVRSQNKVNDWLVNIRGKAYLKMSNNSKLYDKYSSIYNANKQFCLVTIWSFTHIVLYMILGFFCPALFWLTFIIGIFFEIGECIFADCHDVMDLVYNSLGFGIGKLLNHFYFNKKNMKTVPYIWMGISAILLYIIINTSVISQ